MLVWFQMFSGASFTKGAWICDDECWLGLALGWALLGALTGS